MTKKAHIVNPPVDVGEKSLAVCGKTVKVNYAWDDLPIDYPICRDCVDLIVGAANEANEMVELARAQVTRMMRVLNSGTLMDDLIVDTNDWQANRLEKKAKKAETVVEAQRCTCTWVEGDRVYTDPDCPVHGTEFNFQKSDAPVAPPTNTVDD